MILDADIDIMRNMYAPDLYKIQETHGSNKNLINSFFSTFCSENSNIILRKVPLRKVPLGGC